MKILLVNRHRDDVVGGSEIQCDLLARRFTELGHEVTYGVMEPRRTAYAAPYACVPLPAPVSRAFGRLVAGLRPDVVYWRFNKKNLLPCVREARRAGSTFVFAFSHDHDGRPWPPLAPASGKGPAQRTKRRLGAWWRRFGGAIDWLGHGLAHGHVVQHDGQTVPFFAIERRVVRSSVFTEALPFTRERPFVAWVGNLKPRKRPEAFLDLARELADEPIDFLAAGAIHEERYRGWETRAGFPPSLHYLGARSPEDVNGVIAAARFLVLTCEPEGFPNVLMQAWNQGRPTLTLDYDPEGMIATHGLGAVASSPADLARLAREWIRDPERCAAAGERAREYAARTFSVEANADALLAFFGQRRALRTGPSASRSA